jgi:hypothetical protein
MTAIKKGEGQIAGDESSERRTAAGQSTAGILDLRLRLVPADDGGNG